MQIDATVPQIIKVTDIGKPIIGLYTDQKFGKRT